MTLGDWAGHLNGLAFGGSSAYDLQALSGWLDMTESPLGGAGSMSPKQTRNGSWAVPEFMPSRVVTIALQIEQLPGTNFESALSALTAATQPGVGEVSLSLQINGLSTGVKGTVTNRVIPTTLDYLAGYTNAQIEVTCSDPRRLGTTNYYGISLPTSSGGLTWPITWAPLTWSSTQVSGQAVIGNQGNTSGPINFTITGPVTGPVITHQESGLTLAFATSFTIAAGDSVSVNCDARTVLYNGQASRNGYVITRGWPTFLPGNNTYSFNAASYDPSASLAVMATPAWI